MTPERLQCKSAPEILNKKKFLEKAEQLVPDNEKEEFKNAAMIKISDGETTFDCFKREKWENKQGWCETVTSREKSKRWGFCSQSCHYVHADNKPKVISSQKNQNVD